MTPERWNRIQELFEAALELDQAAQYAFLLTECQDDPALLEEVQSLLHADGRLNSLLDGVAIDAVNLPELLGPSQEGQLIGPFQIERELGRGGMGTVYLARRIDGQFDQQVAVKLIRRGLGDDELLRRFQSERQIQARLSHPSIAHLMGGGLTTDGLPYFTMEYVEGQPLDLFCERKQLSVNERIELFIQICEGVQYAHSKLVVHLDLKPGNLFVTEEGAVKILDFGVAKALATDDGAKGSPATSRYLTPEYAAPEQVQRTEVGIPSDVYSLGVVLYELLCGKRPFELAGKSPAEVEHILAEQPIMLPSRQVAGREALARTRKTNADRLQRQLTGDLDNICDKALRKEPERRYASVAALAEDLNRHLEGLPVKARPDTLAYRSRKFVRRNRWAVLGTAITILLLTFSSTFYTFRLKQERDRARLEATKAQQVAGFLTSLFEGADPELANGDTLTAREIMERGAARIENELTGQPEVQAEMMELIGVIYRKIGLPQEGVSWLQKSLVLREELSEPDPLLRAQTLHALGEVYHFMEDWDTADSLLEQSLALRKQHYSAPHPKLAESLDMMGRLRLAQRRVEEAIMLQQQALSMRQELFGENHPEVAESMQSLGVTYLIDYQGEEAVFWLNEAMDIRQNNGNPRIPSLLRSLGEANKLTHNFDEAACYFQEALLALKDLYGEQHPLVANYLRSLALLAADKGEYEDAITYYQKALRITRSLYGDDHRAVGRYLDELATVYYDLRQSEKALPLLQEALSINQQFEPDRQLASIYNNMALCLEDLGELKEAEQYYRASYYLDTLFLPPNHPYLIADCNNLGDLMQDLEDPEAAEAWYRKGLSYAEKGEIEAHWALATAHVFLGRLLTEQGRFDEAGPLLHKGLDLRLKVLPEGNPHIQMARLALAEYFVALKDFEQAEPLALEALSILREQFGEDSPRTEVAKKQVEELYLKWEKPVPASR